MLEPKELATVWLHSLKSLEWIKMYIIRLPNDCIETYVKFSLLCINILVGINGKLLQRYIFWFELYIAYAPPSWFITSQHPTPQRCWFNDNVEIPIEITIVLLATVNFSYFTVSFDFVVNSGFSIVTTTLQACCCKI